MIRFSSHAAATILALLAATLKVEAHSIAYCSSKDVSYTFQVPLLQVGDSTKRQKIFDTVVVSFKFIPDNMINDEFCPGFAYALEPHPLKDVEVLIDDYKIAVPDACLDGATWPLHAVVIRPHKDEILLDIRARAARKDRELIQLSIHLDPYPQRSPFHKKHDLPRIDCDIENEHVWPEGSKMHG